MFAPSSLLRVSTQWGEAVPLSTTQWLTIALSLLLVVGPLNLLLLPVCAIYPPIRNHIIERLRALGDEGEVHGKRRETGYCEPLRMWWDEVVLLEVPFFKA